jgi:hypothetical protein
MGKACSTNGEDEKYKNVFKELEEKRTLGRLVHRWEKRPKMDFRETESELNS